jgi:hypothetical protein
MAVMMARTAAAGIRIFPRTKVPMPKHNRNRIIKMDESCLGNFIGFSFGNMNVSG